MPFRAAVIRVSAPAGLEVVFALLIALTAAGSTWSAYQSARWSGVQAANFARSGTLRAQAAQLTSVAAAGRTIDESLFVAWLAAYADGDAAQQRVLQGHFSARLQPAFEAWQAAGDADSSNGPDSPFDLPAYVDIGAAQIASLSASAEANFTTAEHANQQSDDYVLVTVAFALLIVVAAVGSKFPSIYIQRGAALVGSAGLIAGVVVLAMSPLH